MSEMHIKRRGLLLVLSSPSGAGKTTLSRKLLEADPCLSMSVSVTTRPPRPGEKDGKDYHFIPMKVFERMREHRELMEYAMVFDNFYGTPEAPVMRALNEGRDVLFDIDWQGTQQLMEVARDDLVKVFILPPSGQVLEQRLNTRAQDSQETVARRMAKAADEISHYTEYDYIIVNHDINESLARLQAVLDAERIRRERQVGLSDFVRGLQQTL